MLHLPDLLDGHKVGRPWHQLCHMPGLRQEPVLIFPAGAGPPVARRLGRRRSVKAYGSTDLLDGWRRDLAAWAIPEEITAAVAESPWVLPRQVFARRADRVRAAPSGPSFQRAWAALDPPGSVLDVGSGAGAACLPLLPRAAYLTAVDADADMLEQTFRTR